MVAPFPDTRRIDISRALAGELLKGVERLPLYDNKEFYSPALQTLVHDSIREAWPDDFDWLISLTRESLTRERIAQWPYCVLLRGLRFDEGNQLFVAINRAFGELVARPYEAPRAQLIHYIPPSTDITSSRGGRESERLHTDTADWEKPVELISMVCVRADPEDGGRSRILDVDGDTRRREKPPRSRDTGVPGDQPGTLEAGGLLRWRVEMANRIDRIEYLFATLYN